MSDWMWALAGVPVGAIGASSLWYIRGFGLGRNTDDLPRAAALHPALDGNSNIIKNYDFDRGNAHSAGTFVTSPVYSGSKSLRLVSLGTSGPRTYPLFTEDLTPKAVNAKEGDVFYVEVMVQGDVTNTQTSGGAAGVRFTMAPYSRNNTALTEQYIYLDATTALNGIWTRLSGYVTMPPGSVKAYLYLQLATTVNVNQKYYFDLPPGTQGRVWFCTARHGAVQIPSLPRYGC